MNGSLFVYLFSCWWTAGLFPSWGYFDYRSNESFCEYMFSFYLENSLRVELLDNMVKNKKFVFLKKLLTVSH